MIAYFARSSLQKMVLWCYLAWYLAIVPFYFDPSLTLWLTALGIGGLIGCGLIFATMAPGQKLERWAKIRLFLFPFCVSSYSALIKGKGFILLFPTEAAPLVAGMGACVGVLFLRVVCRAIVGKEKVAR